MSQMSWKYLAGFFDGEGYVYIPAGQARACVRIEFSQSEPRLWILSVIQEFLEEYEISSKLYVYDGNGTLKVFQHEGAVLLLQKLLPHLMLKTDQAREALTVLKARPRRTAECCIRGHRWKENSYWHNGVRQCRACKKELMREYRLQKKGGE